MKRFLHPYRKLSVLLAIMLFAVTVLPANLHPVGLDLFCFADSPVQQTAETDMHCEGMIHDESSENRMQHQDESVNCDLYYSCSCSMDNAVVIKEAVIQGAKSKVILPSNEKNTTAGFHKGNGHWTWDATNLTASPPPIYLLNSSFLN